MVIWFLIDFLIWFLSIRSDTSPDKVSEHFLIEFLKLFPMYFLIEFLKLFLMHLKLYLSQAFVLQQRTPLGIKKEAF